SYFHPKNVNEKAIASLQTRKAFQNRSPIEGSCLNNCVRPGVTTFAQCKMPQRTFQQGERIDLKNRKESQRNRLNTSSQLKNDLINMLIST
ncbi:hypothetical protein Bhyg_11057, partial [Pseudolycoriella hygida]